MIKFDVKECLEVAFSKSKRIAERACGKFPFCGFDEKGEYRLFDEGGWTDSFFPGMLYIAAIAGGGEEYIKLARKYDAAFDVKAGEKLAIQDHDLGFLFTLKDVYDYRITGSEFHKKRALVAADALLKRYRPGAKILPAWEWHPFEPDIDYHGRIICDTMMNMPLLMWAYEETKDERYKEAAVNHSKSAARHLIRDDGSSYHVYDFDPETGEAKGGKTMQGYSDDSCWSRGHSWLVYGFALMYSYTKDEEFLNAAETTAKYFYDHLSAYGMPVWDFAVSELEFRPWDASAGAVAACGMLEIAKSVEDEDKKEYYKNAAIRIMNALTSFCATIDTPELEPLLLHVCGAPIYKKGKELELCFANADTAIIYGDYFYTEALARLANPDVILGW